MLSLSHESLNESHGWGIWFQIRIFHKRERKNKGRAEIEVAYVLRGDRYVFIPLLPADGRRGENKNKTKEEWQ